nr:GHKL domain-containing protein [uncultured Caproiciproducens sp.]
MLDFITKILSYGISCTAGMIIVFDFMRKMYHPHYLNKMVEAVTGILFSIVWFFITMNSVPILNFLYLLVASCLVGFFIYDAKHLSEVNQIVILIVSYAGCDAVTSSFLSIITKSAIPLYSNNSILLLLNVILLQVLMIVVYKLLIVFFKKQKLAYLFKRQFIFLTIFPILNIVVIYIITILAAYKVDRITAHFTIMVMAIISAILNITAVYFFEYVSKSDRLENEILLIQQRMDMQYNYYQQLDLEYDNSQKIMHDIKNHIEIIERLYRTEQNEKGLEYTKKITKIINEQGMKFKSDNRILNIIVNEKIKVCETHKIVFTYSVENLDLDFLDEIDVTAIFANLLDNAIESCEKITSGNRFIELRIYQFNKMIIINLINSVEIVPIKNGGAFVSSKKNHKAIGLSNVKRTVNKYNGDLNIEIEQNKFSVSIMFPIENYYR